MHQQQYKYWQQSRQIQSTKDTQQAIRWKARLNRKCFPVSSASYPRDRRASSSWEIPIKEEYKSSKPKTFCRVVAEERQLNCPRYHWLQLKQGRIDYLDAVPDTPAVLRSLGLSSRAETAREATSLEEGKDKKYKEDGQINWQPISARSAANRAFCSKGVKHWINSVVCWERWNWS